jgi:hypothetical protein
MVMVGQEVESSQAQLRLKCTEKGIVLSLIGVVVVIVELCKGGV